MIACHPSMHQSCGSLLRYPYSFVAKATPPIITPKPLLHRAFCSSARENLANTRETPVRCTQPKMPKNEDFYRFTRARFVCNEIHEMSQRYVRYNIDQLARLAAAAVGSKTCVSIQKCPDGMHNKVLLLTMDDGIQAIAKVPNPNAGRPHFTTASEVATMDFVRKADLLYTSSLINTSTGTKFSWYTSPKSVCLEF